MGSISLRGLKKPFTSKMALLLVVMAALVACSNAGMMHMMQPQQMMMPVGNGGCNEGHGGGCEIPMPTVENVEEYLEKQMEQQQYETKQMAEKVKAEFQAMVYEAMMKKYRYVMSLITEFIGFCQCADVGTQTYQAVFVENARKLNLTDHIDIYDSTKMKRPYEAKDEEEARELIFGELVKTMCESGSNFITFASQVQNRIPAYLPNGKRK